MTIAITPASLPAATVGQPYRARLQANGGKSPYTFTADTVPAGLSLASDGTLSGSATSASKATINVTATDAANAKGKQAVSLTIS